MATEKDDDEARTEEVMQQLRSVTAITQKAGDDARATVSRILADNRRRPTSLSL